MIRDSITRLVEGRDLTRQEAHAAMREIMDGEATPAQVAAYITALRIRGESPDVIAGSALAMREHFTPVHPPSDDVVDTCGTGGDGSHTFNISTAAAFVTAGAGVTVAKHGNRSVSSKCGSADVLEALGVQLNLSPERMAQAMREIGIAFLFAPALHPAMKHAIGPRREIGIRTIFNILGPLSNPAGSRRGVLGVYSAHLVPVLAQAAAELGAVHLFVVHGSDGMDEITLTGPTHVARVLNGEVESFILEPGALGLPRVTSESLAGGDASANARAIEEILSGAEGPRLDIVLANAAAAIVAGGKASTLAEGVDLARQSIRSGAAIAKLEALVAFSQQAGS